MGKTAQGAVWLDGSLFSPYDYFQYWVNADDRDVGRFLRLFTLLPLGEIRRLEALGGRELNEAKRVLATETTKLAHGEEAARSARAAASAAFGGSGDKDVASIPTTRISRRRLEAGIPPAELFAEVGLTPSRGEAKRLIKQGGLYLNDERVDSLDRLVTLKDVAGEGLLLKAGKKKIHRLVLE